MVAVNRSADMLTVAGTYWAVTLLYSSTEPRLNNSLELLTTLSGLRRSLKTMRGATLVPMPVALFGGSARLTCGWSKLKVGPVVKVFVTVPTIVLPAVSLTPLIVMVYVALAASNGSVGVRVNNWLPSPNDGVTATGLPPVVSVIWPMLVG